jgi:zinc transporter, ZIP family
MGEALGFGALAAGSLVLGAALALARPWSNSAVGAVLGFGAGALISAVSFELAAEGARVGGYEPLAAGLAVGAITYFLLARMVERKGSGERPRRVDPGPALALGAFLDGVPEQLVLGLGIASGEGVSVGLLAAVFVSNLPEAIGSSSAMLAAGRPRRVVLGLWTAVALVCTGATVAGFGLGDVASGDFRAAIDGFAAGALLVMLVDSMIPEAVDRFGRAAGLVTVLGFAVAIALSATS